MQSIRLKDRKAHTWKNGGGITTELFRIPHPDDPEQFYFRISLAQVDKSGPFSFYNGIERHLILLNGNGMHLINSRGDKTSLDRPMQIFQFPGEEPIDCTLINGSNEDFNIMVDRNWGEASVTVKKIRNGETLEVSSKEKTFIYQVKTQTLIQSEYESWDLIAEQDLTLILITLAEKIDKEISIKKLERGHTDEFFSLINRNRFYLKQWLGWLDNIQTNVQLEQYIENSLIDIAEEKLYRAWIWYQGKIVGIVHLAEVDWVRRKAMVGYWIGQEYSGKGLTTKAVALMIDFAFREWKLHEIEIRCATGNIASQRVAMKLGFTRTGILHECEWLYDHHVDHIVFTKHEKDWCK